MHTASEVDKKIEEWKQTIENPSEIAVNIAEWCLGWAYVFGARGEYCTPANRRKYYRDSHPTIKTKCKNYDSSSSCSGCKWFPSGQKTRIYDCRGFTYWVLLQIGIKITGAGATSQWNNDDNWSEKGLISDMPLNQVCCVFKANGKTMEHTGLHVGNGRIIHCSNGVQTGKTTDKGWSHYAIPKGLNGEVTPVDPTPSPEPSTDFPTLCRGSKGQYVTLLQTKLMQKGYDLGSYGVDGDFGKQTEKALKQFQQDHGLTADGIAGKKTWTALNEQITNLYTVVIPHLPKFKAESLIKDYSGSSMTEERG